MSIVFLLLFPLALAQPATQSTQPSEAKFEAVTQIDEAAFSELALEGQLVRPSGMLGVVVPRPGFHPLFQIRREFNTEIKESPSLVGSAQLP